jgi:hypothetical protein
MKQSAVERGGTVVVADALRETPLAVHGITSGGTRVRLLVFELGAADERSVSSAREP